MPPTTVLKCLTVQMKTQIFNSQSKEDIIAAAKILKNGGVVAIPTETVYGLAASCFDENAVKNVFAAKGRPQDNPLILHVDGLKMLEQAVADIPQIAKKCAKCFWPGPFTMVLKRNNNVPASVCGGLDTAAVRCPAQATARAVITAAGVPLAAPSANISGSPSPTSWEHVISDLDGKIDAVICDVPCEFGVESTVVSLVGEHPRLLRPGAVTLEQLREILPDIEVDGAVTGKFVAGKASSPGMKYRHYAPKGELYMLKGESTAFADYVNQKNDGVALVFEEEADLVLCEKLVYGSIKDMKKTAHKVFDVLRELDKKGIKKAYVHAPDTSGVGLAVYNRLQRACEFREITL